MQRIENNLLGDNAVCRIFLVNCRGSQNVKTFYGGLLVSATVWEIFKMHMDGVDHQATF